MISPMPQAWIGFGHDKRTGEFYVKICDKCEEKARAIAEASSSKLNHRIMLCDKHVYESINHD